MKKPDQPIGTQSQYIRRNYVAQELDYRHHSKSLLNKSRKALNFKIKQKTTPFFCMQNSDLRKKKPYGYMIADVFYLFLWDNIKLHTVNVSIVGFGVLVFSL